MTATAQQQNRIITILGDAEPGAAPGGTRTLGSLNASASPWAIARRYGDYLLAGLTGEQQETMADALAEIMAERRVERGPLAPGSIGERLRAELGGTPSIAYRADDLDVIVVTGTPRNGRRILGDCTWRRSRTAERRRVIAFRLPTMAGACALLDYADEAAAMRVCAERAGCLRAGDAERIRASATLAWAREGNRIMNSRWERAHGATAGVFDDKKHCPQSHRDAAESSVFARLFGKVEIDEDVDLEAFGRLCAEFEQRWNAGELPAVAPDTEWRFRKTMRHRAGGGRAIGLYAPHRNAIAIDPRHPEAIIHEMAHAHDYVNGQLSLTDQFLAIVDAYAADLEALDLTAAARLYLRTPTEAWARLTELDVHERGLGGSLNGTDERYRDPAAYCLLANRLPAFRELVRR